MTFAAIQVRRLVTGKERVINETMNDRLLGKRKGEDAHFSDTMFGLNHELATPRGGMLMVQLMMMMMMILVQFF